MDLCGVSPTDQWSDMATILQAAINLNDNFFFNSLFFWPLIFGDHFCQSWDLNERGNALVNYGYHGNAVRELRINYPDHVALRTSHIRYVRCASLLIRTWGRKEVIVSRPSTSRWWSAKTRKVGRREKYQDVEMKRWLRLLYCQSPAVSYIDVFSSWKGW